MTRRDMRWRSAGAIIGLAAGAVALTTDNAQLVVALFLAILLGLTLMINGKRVAVAFKAERRGHHHTAAIIHARRVRRHRRGTDEAG